MKILQVNSVYGKGSTGKITMENHKSLLENGFQSIVCYGRGKKIYEEGIYKTCGEIYSKLNHLWSCINGLIYGGCRLSTQRLIKRIKQEMPDVVHLQCINGYFVNIPMLIKFLKKSGIKTILTLHAEFMYTANCGHSYECEKWKTGCGKCPQLKEATGSYLLDRTHTSWVKMKDAFDGFDEKLTVVSVSPWLMDRAKQSPILGNKKHTVILNGLDTDIFKPYPMEDIRKELGIAEDEKVVFHATPGFSLDPNHIKGGFYVVELAKRMREQKVRFVVAGKYDQSQQYPGNMLMLGQVHDQVRLARFYSMANVTLLTSKRETFSMVVAESLCCGTPIVGFEAGAPEQIAIKKYSKFVVHGDMEALYESVLHSLMEKYNANVSVESSYVYSKMQMVENYINYYSEDTK